MAENNKTKEAPIAAEQKTPAQKPGAHETNRKKIRIDPMNDASEIAQSMLQNIRNALRSPQLHCHAVRGLAHFSSFEGEIENHKFVVKYTPATKNCINDKLYVAYDGYEFEIQEYYSTEITVFFKDVEEHIKANFIFDLNSRTYVPRPKEQGLFANIFSGLFGGKRR